MKEYLTTNEIKTISNDINVLNLDSSIIDSLKELNDFRERECLTNYILLTDSGKFENNLLTYYSRYYWLMSYIERSKVLKREDVGLEQQLFKLIEESEHLSLDVNWDVIQNIENIIKSS